MKIYILMGDRAELIYSIIDKTKSGDMTWNQDSTDIVIDGSPEVEKFVFYSADPTPGEGNKWTFLLYRAKLGVITFKYVLQLTKFISNVQLPSDSIDDEPSIKELWDYLNSTYSEDPKDYINSLET